MYFNNQLSLVVFVSCLSFFAGITASISSSEHGRIEQNTRSSPIVVPLPELLEARALPLRQSFTTTYPPWANLTLMGIGQAFMRDNFLGFVYGLGLGGGATTNPDIIRTLVGIGNITNHYAAMQRSLSNVVYFKYWSIVDLIKDQDVFLETLNTIHSMHGEIGYNTFQKWAEYNKPIIPEPSTGQNPYKVNLNVWNAFEADLRASKYKDYENEPLLLSKSIYATTNGSFHHHPMNQFTIAHTLWLLTHAIVAVPENVLVFGATEEEIMGYLHLWAFIGSAMGLEDKYNVCLQPNLDAARKYFQGFLEMYVIPAFFHLDYEYKVFIEAQVTGLLDAVYPIGLAPGVLLLRVCEDMLEIQCPHLRASLNPQSKFYNMFMGQLGHAVLRLPPAKSSVRFLVNGLIQTSCLKNYKINTLYYNNYTAGILELSEQILQRSSNLQNLNDIRSKEIK